MEKIAGWASLLLEIVNAPSAPHRLIERIASLLLGTVTSAEAQPNSTVVDLLSAINQRYPEPFRLATSHYRHDLPEEAKEGFDGIITRLTIVCTFPLSFARAVL